MTISEPDFWDYAIFTDDGELLGIDEDAPKEVKKEFEKYANMLKGYGECGSIDFDALAKIK